MPRTVLPTYTSVVEGLNLRSAPSLQGPVRRVLKKGTVVRRLDVSGDGYWLKVRVDRITGWAAQKYLQARTGSRVAPDFPWYAIARAEIGVREVQGNGDNPRIVEYLQSTTLDAPSASQDETPWCSAFANWCVERAGHAGTDSAWARSWLKWGRETAEPRRGCIVVLSRLVTSGHVGFFVSANRTHVTLLGGNQGDQVCESAFPLDRLLGYRLPR
jgi:uncharacterized protein (TIGR02594 family)